MQGSTLFEDLRPESRFHRQKTSFQLLEELWFRMRAAVASRLKSRLEKWVEACTYVPMYQVFTSECAMFVPEQIALDITNVGDWSHKKDEALITDFTIGAAPFLKATKCGYDHVRVGMSLGHDDSASVPVGIALALCDFAAPYGALAVIHIGCKRIREKDTAMGVKFSEVVSMIGDFGDITKDAERLAARMSVLQFPKSEVEVLVKRFSNFVDATKAMVAQTMALMIEEVAQPLMDVLISLDSKDIDQYLELTDENDVSEKFRKKVGVG